MEEVKTSAFLRGQVILLTQSLLCVEEAVVALPSVGLRGGGSVALETRDGGEELRFSVEIPLAPGCDGEPWV